jgi:hypothetical protein
MLVSENNNPRVYWQNTSATKVLYHFSQQCNSLYSQLLVASSPAITYGRRPSVAFISNYYFCQSYLCLATRTG